MSRGMRRKHVGLLAAMVVLLMTAMVMVVINGCGGSDSEANTTTTAASSTPSDTAQGGAEGQGVLVATEILDTFDEIVAEAAALAAGKPDPATLKPQLEELYASYEPTMAELNTKYLGLRDSDTKEWGACNSFLGENRGPRVAAKDTTLTDALLYYNLELGDQEIVGLLSTGAVKLLDIAVAQN